MRKITLIAIVATLLAGATSASAQLLGTWAGQGKGSCYPYSDCEIFPWQNWKGVVYYPEDAKKPVFEGEWHDAEGNYGTFFGKNYPTPIEEYYLFKGEWTWYDPASETAEPVVGGSFEMKFYFIAGTSSGFWDTEWPSLSEQGTMWGKWEGE